MTSKVGAKGRPPSENRDKSLVIEHAGFIRALFNSQKLDVTQMVCNIGAIFDNIKVLNKTSSSSTVQMLAEIKPAQSLSILQEYFARSPLVFLKIAFHEPGRNDEIIERSIYKYLTKLVINHRTPNFMRFVAAFACNNLLRLSMSLDPVQGKKLERSVQTLDPDINTGKLTIMILQRGDGASFYDILKRQVNGIDEHDFMEIMLQLFYTLREMFRAKVRHNDLHLGNIWIDVLAAPMRLVYFVNDDEYAVIETAYVVKIYDFDRSAFTGLSPKSNMRNINIDKDFCPAYGMCANENPYFDIHTVMHGLLDKFGSTDFIFDFVTRVVKSWDYLDQDCCVFPGRMCKIDTTKRGMKCMDNFSPAPGEIYDFTDLWMKTPVFDRFKKSLTKDGFSKADLPLTSLGFHNQVPESVFKTNVYFSSVCSLPPMLMANKLLVEYGK